MYGIQALQFASIAEKWMEIGEGGEGFFLFSVVIFFFIPAASRGQSAHLSHACGKYITYWSGLGGIL